MSYDEFIEMYFCDKLTGWQKFKLKIYSKYIDYKEKNRSNKIWNSLIKEYKKEK